MNPPTTLAATSAPSRDTELTDAYVQTLPAGNVSVITARVDVDLRAAQLQAKLGALGITDLTDEGNLVLAGTTEITPGVRRGVPMTSGTIGTADNVGFDNLSDFFSYTKVGSAAPLAPLAVNRSVELSPARAGGGATFGGLNAGSGQLSPTRTLVMSPSSVLLADEAIIAVDELQLQDGTELLIANNVKYLTILANRITVGDDTKVTWDSIVPADRAPSGAVPGNGTSHARTSPCDHSWFYATDGGSGDDGRDGDDGYPGDDAPTVEIWSLDAERLPEFVLKGGVGGRGQPGGRGGNGGHGAKGSNSWANLLACAETVGYGGDGGDGGKGGVGGQGGRGGHGGRVVLYLTDPCHEAVLAAGLTLHPEGGEGGAGGPGGAGGQRGLGGEAGDPNGLWCSAKPERAGDAGFNGEVGGDGSDGRNGRLFSDGDVPNLTAIVITEDEFLAKWTAPQIRTVTPWEVEVGDVVTVEGANYTSTATVSLGGTTVATTFFSDTTLQAAVPPMSSGWNDVLVQIPGGQTSNPASVKVLPSLGAATPNPAWPGVQVTFTGSGFEPDCRVLFRGLELVPDSVSTDGTQVLVTLPRPQGPFEDRGGTEAVSVRNPDGVATRSIDLQMRHVLSTGFDVPTNGYSFLNAKANIAGVADLGTFTETYGLIDLTLESLIKPGLTKAYFAFYLLYFNEIKAGYSSAFAMTAIDAYWSGTTNLFGEHSSLADVEDLLTVAQGHILSREVLTELGLQSAVGVARAEISLDEIEDVFRQQIALPDDELRRVIAPVMQLMPAGLPVTPSYFTDLSASHGLLPIRVEYPVAGERWEKRLVVYDNASLAGVGTESQIDFTRNGDTLDFAINHIDPTLPNPVVPASPAKNSSNGWTLSHVPLSFCWLTNVSMPLSGVWLLPGGATLRVEDSRGRRYGVAGGRAWGDIPGVVPGVGVKNLYLLPFDQDLSFTITGTEDNDGETYTLSILAGPLGRSVTVSDVAVGPTTRDTVRIANGLREITIESSDASKEIVVHYDLAGIDEVRSVALDGARVGKQGGLTLRTTDDLSSFDVVGGQPQHPISVELAANGRSGPQQHVFQAVPIGGGRAQQFTVDAWERLGPASLKRARPSKPSVGRAGAGVARADQGRR